MLKLSLFILASSIVFVLLMTNKVYSQVQFFPNSDTCHYFNTVSSPHFPPVESDMPFDILISWIVLDSVCRNASYADVLNWASTTTQDSLRQALKYYFKLQDYNPLLLDQYSWDVRRIRSTLRPQTFYFGIREIYEQRFGNISYNLKALLNSDYIFHVSVVNQTSFIKYLEDTRSRAEVFCADLQILDKIKGQKLYPSCTYLPGIKESHNRSLIDNCIRVTWVRSLLEDARCEQDTLDFYAWGPSHMEPSKEYFLLLDHDLQWFNGDTITWATRAWIHDIEQERYMYFPIINGKVQDPKNKLGFGNDIPISQYKNNIRSVIATFLGL